MFEKNLKTFNQEFFKKIESESIAEHEKFLEDCISEYEIKDEQEIKSIIIYFYWNFYFDKLFSNFVVKKNLGDPRKSVLFRYCYKLQRETKNILEIDDYKDYVFCQIKYYKNYVDKTGKPVQIGPNILNFDKGWKKYKYFKYLLNKNKYSDKKIPFVNNDVLKISLQNDRRFLENKIKISIFSLKSNIENIYLWNKVGKISIFFIAFNYKTLKDYKKDYRDYSVYKFDETGVKIFKSIFPELS